MLEELLNQKIVVDMRTPYVCLGTLARCDADFLELKNADLHDLRDGDTTREVYVAESRRTGIKRNRKPRAREPERDRGRRPAGRRDRRLKPHGFVATRNSCDEPRANGSCLSDRNCGRWRTRPLRTCGQAADRCRFDKRPGAARCGRRG